MKISVFLFLAGIISISAANSYSQTTKLSLEVREVSVGEVLTIIENQSEFYFLYSNKLVDANRKVSLHAKNKPVRKILDHIFADTDVRYVVYDRQIILSPEEMLKKTIEQQNPPPQEIVVTGQVTNEDGNSLPGVNIVERGSSRGVITDVDGNYKINVSKQNAVLSFSFIGYESQEIKVGGSLVIDIVMAESFMQLDEIVVTALGIKRERKALGYSVGEVTNEEVLQSNEPNIVSALSGKVAGVAISTSTGQAGGSARITIRGNSSISYNNQPLFVIDGIPFDNSESTIKSLSSQGGGTNTAIDIDPNYIEKITVLKGASASALYGSKAANGVVIITTKQGVAGKTRINYSYKTGIDDLIEIPLQQSWSQGDFINGAPTFMDGETMLTSNSWGPRIEDVPGAVKYDRWDYWIKGHKTENNFNISGGNEKINYYSSVTLFNQQGLLKPIKLKKVNMFFKANVIVNKWMDASASFNYSNTATDRISEGFQLMYTFLQMPHTWNPYPFFDENGVMRKWTTSSRANPYWMIENTLDTSRRNRFFPKFELNFNIAEGLTLNTRVGIDSYTTNEDDYVNSGSSGGSKTGKYNVKTSQYFHFNSDFILNYDKHFGDDFALNVMVGNNIQSNRTEYKRINGKDFIIPNFKHINNCQTQVSSYDYTQYRSTSAYGQVGLGYKDMIYYTFTGRNDWSSTLPLDEQSYFYSSNSISFLFSELIDMKIINFGKLRAAYSQVGNDAPPYSIYNSYISGGGGGLTFPYQGVGTFQENTSANNSALKNEMTNEIEIGLEMKLFQDRFGFEASLYDRTSFNQIVRANLPNSTGFDDAIINIGEVNNKGIEVLVYGTPVRLKDFRWDVTVNYSYNKNRVIKISEGVDKIEDFAGWCVSIWKGYSFPQVELQYFIEDERGNFIVDDDPLSDNYGYQISTLQYGYTKRPSAQVNPDWRGGIRNSLSYKGWTLAAFIDGMFGGHQHNMVEQYLLGYGMSSLNEDRPDDGNIVWPGVKGHIDLATGELIISEEPNDIVVSYVDAFLHKGYKFNENYKAQPTDYVKLREVTLSYDLPKNLLAKTGFIKGARISFTGNNLWRWFHKGFTSVDPEYNLRGSAIGGLNLFSMPSYKSYNFGINLSF